MSCNWGIRFTRSTGRAFAAAVLICALGATGAGDASARLPVAKKKEIQEIKIERKEELRFGKLVVLGTSGRVRVPTEGLIAYENAVRVSGPTGPARLTFTGAPNKTIEVRVTAPIQTELSPTGELQLESLTVEPMVSLGVNKFPNAIRMKLDSTGTNGIVIGGSLVVTPNGSSGPTTILIPVTASYIDAY